MDNVIYHYIVHVVDVYDGDTCTVEIDLGLHTWIKVEKIRFNRINAPELRGAERVKGLWSRDFLRSLILNKQLVIETIKNKKGKYRRYLGEIWLVDEKGKSININDVMVANGVAKY